MSPEYLPLRLLASICTACNAPVPKLRQARQAYRAVLRSTTLCQNPCLAPSLAPCFSVMSSMALYLLSPWYGQVTSFSALKRFPWNFEGHFLPLIEVSIPFQWPRLELCWLFTSSEVRTALSRATMACWWMRTWVLLPLTALHVYFNCYVLHILLFKISCVPPLLCTSSWEYLEGR